MIELDVFFLDIFRFLQYRLYGFLGFCWLKMGCGDWMASILHALRGKQSAYLAGYFGLLLFAVSGLVLQGGVWMVGGVVGWFSVVVACLLLRYRGKGAKNMKDVRVGE